MLSHAELKPPYLREQQACRKLDFGGSPQIGQFSVRNGKFLQLYDKKMTDKRGKYLHFGGSPEQIGKDWSWTPPRLIRESGRCSRRYSGMRRGENASHRRCRFASLAHKHRLPCRPRREIQESPARSADRDGKA